ncbi:MAG: hypothetical protein ACP5N1_02495 [Candidatus Woesearchaeota archaeon]
MIKSTKKTERREVYDVKDVIVLEDKKKTDEFEIGRDSLDTDTDSDDELDFDADFEFDDGGD